MIRILAQILMGFMLLFGAATLFPKAYREFKSGRIPKALLSTILGLLALFFSCMAFFYAYLGSLM
jgi:hypothetical protein